MADKRTSPRNSFGSQRPAPGGPLPVDYCTGRDQYAAAAGGTVVAHATDGHGCPSRLRYGTPEIYYQFNVHNPLLKALQVHGATAAVGSNPRPAPSLRSGARLGSAFRRHAADKPKMAAVA